MHYTPPQPLPLFRLAVVCALVGVLALLLLLVGCGPKSNTGTEQGLAPRSPITYEQGRAYAAALAGITGGSYSMISPTGSMEPILDSSSLVVFVPAADFEIKPGMVVSYTREGKNTVTHKVLAVTDTHFIPAGVANMRNDGRIELSRIERIMIAPIYTEGRQ